MPFFFSDACFPSGVGDVADLAEVQALRSQLEETWKALEDSVSRTEMQVQITDATAAARGVISSLEEKITQLEEVKILLHAQVQTTLKMHQDLKQ